MKLPPRKILLNPGPATTSDTVKLSQIVSDICPREVEFELLMNSIRINLLDLVNASSEIYSSVLFSGSGTLVMDSLISSLVPENKKILLLNNGAYTQRAVDICSYYGISYIDLKMPYNEPINLDLFQKTLNDDPDISVVYTTHHETGSGLLNPINEISKITFFKSVIFIVDTISSFAMIPLDLSENKIDFIMSSSQKGISAMAGMAFVIGKTELIEKSSAHIKKSYYSNLYRQYSHFLNFNQMHFTPPVQTLYSVKQALFEIKNEGLVNKFKRHNDSFNLLEQRLVKLGFKFYIERKYNAGLLLSILYPQDENWTFESIHDYCYAHGFTIYPGKINENTFRLSVFGDIKHNDIDNFMNCFESGLDSIGVQIPIIY